MPRNPNKKAVEAALTNEEYEAFSKIARQREWSNKKLAEIVVRAFIRADNKNEMIELGKKES